MRERGPRTLDAGAPRVTRGMLAFTGLTSAVLTWALMDDLGLMGLLPFLRGSFPTVLIAAALGALIGLTRARILLHLSAVAAIVLLFVVCYSPLAARLAQPLKLESPPAKADAIVVLAAQIQPDNDFEYHSQARIVRGLELMKGKFAPRLVLTELPPPYGSHRVAVATLTARLGIACPLVTVGPVRNTHDEAVLVNRLARERGWKRVLLVTSPTHSRRSALTFRKAGLEVISTPCRETYFDLEKLDKPGDRINAFEAAMHEIVGLRIYRARGWL